jgi:hypothetical protein
VALEAQWVTRLADLLEVKDQTLVMHAVSRCSALREYESDANSRDR